MRASRTVAAALLLACVGCGVQQPAVTPSSATVAPSGSLPVRKVGSDGSSLGQVVAELEAQALSATGLPATTELAPAQLDEGVAKLTSGDLSVLPVFARTAASALELGELPEETNELVSALAQALDGEAAVMQPGQVTNDAQFVVSRSVATTEQLSSLADLARLRQPVRIAAPPGFDQAPEGSAGLDSLYGVRATFDVIADPQVRLEKLGQGASVAVVRPTEPRHADLVTLTDPNRLVQPDPLVVLLAPHLAGDQDVVLALKALNDKLTNAELAALMTRADQVGAGPAATEWLKAKGLA